LIYHHVNTTAEILV